ncbi:MAG TPA: DNA replication/repair protein RecF [Firmicutes bacterium]|nr:DNA replication/repair protein RecF [Bacillota bacterium]
MSNFRNYEKLDLKLGGSVNLFLGNNAQGKTNLLEAVEVAATSRSHRTNRDSELVRWGQDGYYIKARFRLNGSHSIAEVGYSPGRGRIIRIDGAPPDNPGEYRVAGAVFFGPDDLQIIKGPPSGRRKLIDTQAAHIYPGFRSEAASFARILNQRNWALRGGSRVENHSDLDVWDEQFAVASARIMNRRIATLMELRPILKAVYKRLAPDGDLEIRYLPSMMIENDSSPVTVESLRSQVEERRADDLARRVTTAGPHRDDFLICLNDVDIRVYGSQGQQRSAVLALKLAELELASRLRESPPILLLDDVFSELDLGHRMALAAAVRDTAQTFVTCTDLDTIPQCLCGAFIFRVEGGSVHPASSHTS